MKTTRTLLLCIILVFPLSIFAQVLSPSGIQCHAAFKADVTYTCNSFLKVSFKDESVIPGGQTTTRWTWDFGDGAMSNDWQPSHIYDKPGKYTVKLTIHTNAGWSDSSVRENYIHVGGFVYVNLGNDTTIENRATLVLDAGNPGSTYLWSTGETTQKITVSEAGQYWVKVKKNNCESSDRINVNIKSQPVPPTNFVADVTYTCNSALRVSFRDLTVLEEGDAISRWTWIFGDGDTSHDWKPTHDYTRPGKYTVKLIVQTAFGRSDTAVRNDYIFVEGKVYVNLGNDTTITEGSSLVLDAGNPGSTYFWNIGAFTQKITVTEGGEYWVHLKRNGCESSDRIFVTVRKPEITFTADSTSTCNSYLRVNFDYKALLEPGDFISRWTWVLGDGDTTHDWKPRHDYTRPGVYTVKLIINTDHGYVYEYERKDYIKVKGEVFVDLGKDTSICEGSSITLDAGNPGSTYFWNIGAFTQTITVSEPGEYWVHIKRDGCESRDRINVYNRPPLFPQFGFGLSNNCLPVKASFTDSSSACSGTTIVRRLWDFGDGTTSSALNPVHHYNTADTFVVRLTIWDENGFAISRNKRVVVNAPTGGPVVNLGNDTTVCESEMLVLDAGNPDASFTWSTGDIYQTCVVTNPGMVWVRVEQNGCVASDSIMVKMVPTLNPKFGYQYLQSKCPATIQFRDSSLTCGVEIAGWRWDFGDETTSSEQHPQHSYTSSGDYIVRLTVWDNIGNSMTRSKLVTVKVEAVTVSLGRDTAICFGETLYLNAGFAGATYLWSTGETSQGIAVQDDGEYSVQVNTGGCMGYDTIVVRTISPVIPAFENAITGNCLPVDVKFNDRSTVSCNQQIVQWRWDFGDGSTSNLQHPVHTYQTSDTFAVRLTVITDGGFSISKSRRIYIANTIPAVNAGADLTVCKGDMVQLDAGVDGATYKWTPASTLDNNSIRRPLASPTQTTTYTVAVTQCNTTVTDQIVVFVNAAETPTITQQGKKLLASAGTSYQWYKDGELIRGAQTNTLQPNGAGQYSVKVRNAVKGCVVESGKFYYLPDSRKENWMKDIRVRLSPNPSPGYVYVIFAKLPERPVAVTVIDRYGQRLFTKTINGYANLLNLQRLAKGHYSIELMLGTEKIALPLLIQ